MLVIFPALALFALGVLAGGFDNFGFAVMFGSVLLVFKFRFVLCFYLLTLVVTLILAGCLRVTLVCVAGCD